MDQQPLVSIVTPSYNSARFMERTIESVLSQDYPSIEYLVMDGGSTDESLTILERYQGRLQYFSAKDKGPADAVHQGFARSNGAILGWLNSDDEYAPGAVTAAVRELMEHPEAGVVYGEGVWIDEDGREIGRYPTTSPYRDGMFEQECGICQPAAFLRREAFFESGGMKTDQNSCWDYDLWIRISRRHRFLAVPRLMARSRMHRNTITLAGRRLVFEQNIALLRREFGYVPVNWVYGYLSFLRDGRDQFFEPLQHSATVYLGSLAVGSFYNYRHPWRYWKEWASRLKRLAPFRGR
jgi:glycosyltransferase involved in cell wall biosynthesis